MQVEQQAAPLSESNSSWPTLGESREQPQRKKERSTSTGGAPLPRRATNEGPNDSVGHRKNRTGRGVPLPPQEQEKLFRVSNPPQTGGQHGSQRRSVEIARDRHQERDRNGDGERHRR